MIARISRYLTCALTAFFLCSCSRSNNLLMGTVEAEVAGHRFVVTDCYRTSVPLPKEVAAGVYRFTPCRDADILIKGEELSVNNQPYGHLAAADSILVDHGVVSKRHAARN